MKHMGRMLIVIGVAFVVIGVIVTLVPIRLGRLPGDIVVRWRNGAFYFPLVTCLLLSLLLTWLWRKL